MVLELDPIRDPRWQRLLLRHPRASVFHTPGWLEALQRTYGYEPVGLTTSAPGEELVNGVVFCRIHSRLTGRRLVSLPFSDHCEPLADSQQELTELLGALARAGEKARYVEIRPRTPWVDVPQGFAGSKEYVFHTLDLGPSLDVLFRGLHRDCIQRKIRRAEREGLTAEEGRSEQMLRGFYALMLLARRRQRLPPQPWAWFRNLVRLMGDALSVQIASKDGRAVAGILTLRYKDVLVYKYGCADARWNNLGGMPLLFWRTIQRTKEDGLREIDFGRSDCENRGLIEFKDRLGCARSSLRYWRSPAHAAHAGIEWTERVGRPLLGCVPAPLLPALGKVVTRHLG